MIISTAQTPTPTLTIGQSSPYSRLATDPISFYCSFTYPTSTYLTLTYLNLYLKITSASVSISDTTIATLNWANPSTSTAYSFYSSASYSSRLTVSAVSDSGAAKNYAIIFATYTTSDITPYYYCEIADSTGSSVYSSLVQLQGYCMSLRICSFMSITLYYITHIKLIFNKYSTHYLYSTRRYPKRDCSQLD